MWFQHIYWDKTVANHSCFHLQYYFVFKQSCVRSSDIVPSCIDVQGERKNETQKESTGISGSFKKDKMKVSTDIQERRDWWTNLSSFPFGAGKIDHCKACALCTVIILPESQDRSSQNGLLATVLHSLHFHYSSLWMHTQTAFFGCMFWRMRLLVTYIDKFTLKPFAAWYN